MEKKWTAFLASFIFIVIPLVSQNMEDEVWVGDLIQGIQNTLDTRDLDTYLGFYRADLRDLEEAKLKSMWNDFQIEKISLYSASARVFENNRAHLVLRAMYENAHTVIIELWRLNLVWRNASWQIDTKDVADDIQTLYKIAIPSDKTVKAPKVEISHTDITLSFEDATVFFDNLPNSESALLVTGKGRLRFSPSLPRERHQLELLYGSAVLEDDLKYVYIRCSTSFYRRNIKITEEKNNAENVTQSEKKKAYSLFMKHYSRSFTIENSLDGALLSFLPQGDEAVFEFEGNKIGNYSYIYSPFAEEEINFYQWKEQRIVNLYSPQVYDDKKQLFISIGQKFDITDYQVEINFRPVDYFLSGRAKISVESEIGSFDVLKFKLNSGLQILRINDDEKQRLFYTMDKLRQSLYVYLPPSPRKYTQATIEIFYRGNIEPNTSLADVVEGAQFDETLVLIPPRYETYLYTQSSFWYPAPADDDYFTASVSITLPPGYSVVSNGTMTAKYEIEGLESFEDIERVGSMVSIFETKKPVKYLSFIAGRLNRIEESTNPFPLQYYRAYDVRGQKWDYLGEAKKILSFFESKFGAYPYENFSIVHRLWPRQGGHSPPSFVVINEMPRIPAGYQRGVSNSPVDLSRWKEYYLAHEIAHQWWGQSVTWNSYHDQWLSEGLSQFAAVLYLEEKYGDKVLPWIFNKFSSWTERMSKWGAITMGSRISYFDFEAFQSVVYDKTTLELNMLREVVGEDVFFRALREFLDQKRYSSARSREFFSVFNRVSGKDLSPFFEKWFDSYLLPEISVKHSYQKSGDEFYLTMRIVQSKGPFVFPLWVEWKENGVQRRERVLVEERIQEFSFKVADKPARIRVNPDKAVPGIFR